MKKHSILLVACFGLFTFFAQAQSYTRTISVTFDTLPSTYSIQTAKLKFDKKIAYSLTIDDGFKDVWDVAYPLIQGDSVVIEDYYAGINYGSDTAFQKIGGYTFDDGCGHEVPYHLGVAINASQIAKNNSRLNWSHLSTLLEAGWDVLNHGHYHDETVPIDFQDEIVQNSNAINDHIGFYPRHFVIPANQPAYAPVTDSFGMVATYGTVYGFQGVYDNGVWNVNDDITDVDSHLQYTRTSIPLDAEFANLAALESSFATIVNQSQDHASWYNEYTHAVNSSAVYPNESNLGFKLFQEYLDYINQTYNQVWVAGLQEVEEYLFVRQNAVISNEFLTGNVLTFDVTLDASQLDQRHFDLSLLVAGEGANVADISVQDSGYATVNPTTGLVNFQLMPYIPPPCNDYTISGEVYFDVNLMPGPYGQITVMPGAVLNITPGTELSFCPNGELIVEPGGQLNFLGTMTAESYWKGVNIKKNATESGRFRGYRGALIEHAELAIYSELSEGYSSDIIPVICERTTFRNNHQGVNFENNTAAFYQCTFENTDSFQQPLGFGAFAKLKNIGGQGVLFSSCQFIENRVGVVLTDNGIIAENAIFVVD